MQFRGRTVVTLVVITMLSTLLITMAVTDKLIQPSASTSSVVSAATNSSKQLNKKEIEKLNAVIDLVESKYVTELNRGALIDGAVTGIMNALNDPYSVYMEEKVASQFSQSIEGSFSGIGAEVANENGQIIVVSPIKGSPAERAGLLPKDIILTVNGDSLSGLSLQEAVNKIRGKKGTQVKLEIVRVGVKEPINVDLVRDDIDIETIYSSIDDRGIGVIEITQFSMHTSERFAEELKALESKGLKGLVIDVRNNPGGVLQGVVEISQLMMKEGAVVVQVEGRDGKKDKTYAKGGAQKTYPIAVLTNGGSASASEILAGALQEGAGAKVVGEQSFGKGTVQVSYNQLLDGGGLIKLTIAKWLTPKGNWIHEIGVKPDIEVKPAAVYSAARLTVTETLQQNDLSESIRSVQIMLNGIGFETDRQDGYFSAKTANAVKAFQESKKIKATGKVDVQTAQLLEKDAVDYIRNPKNDVQLQKALEVVGRK